MVRDKVTGETPRPRLRIAHTEGRTEVDQRSHRTPPSASTTERTEWPALRPRVPGGTHHVHEQAGSLGGEPEVPGGVDVVDTPFGQPLNGPWAQVHGGH